MRNGPSVQSYVFPWTVSLSSLKLSNLHKRKSRKAISIKILHILTTTIVIAMGQLFGGPLKDSANF